MGDAPFDTTGYHPRWSNLAGHSCGEIVLDRERREDARCGAIFWNEGDPLRDGVRRFVDLDGLAPAFAPGVSHHEPGGLSTRQVIDLIHDFKGRLIGGDVVELNPHRDVNGMTAMVAA